MPKGCGNMPGNPEMAGITTFSGLPIVQSNDLFKRQNCSGMIMQKSGNTDMTTLSR